MRLKLRLFLLASSAMPLLLTLGCGGGGSPDIKAPPATPSAPVFTSQPQDQVVIQGDVATFLGLASGNPAPTFAWQGSMDGNTWTVINGQSQASYSFTTAVDSYTRYQLIASNTLGTATSSMATLTMVGIQAFAAARSAITTGTSTTLSFEFTGGTATIDHGIGSVTSGGTKNISPTSDTTYTLTVTNGGKRVTKSITVNVRPVPTAVFTATPLSIDLGGTTTLAWNTSNTYSVTISPSINGTALPLSGWQVVTPLFGAETSFTYTLTASNGTSDSTGTITKALTITMPGPTITGLGTTSESITVCYFDPIPNTTVPVSGSQYSMRVAGTWTSGSLTAPDGTSWDLGSSNGESQNVIQCGRTELSGTCPSIEDRYCDKGLGDWRLLVTRNNQTTTQTFTLNGNGGGSCAW